MRREAAILAPVLLGAACNALNGVGDLDEVACVGPCGDGGGGDAPAPDGATTLDVSTGTDAPAQDAPVALDGGQGDYCNGITFYVTFDGTFTSQEGVAPETVPFLPTFVDGKFGKAVDLRSNTAGGTYGGVAYPVTLDAGTSYSATIGTMAMWVQPGWSQPCGAQHGFVKPKDDPFPSASTAGPEMVCVPGPGLLGAHVHQDDGGDTYAGLPIKGSGVASSWKDKDWNFIVATWSEAAPSLGFALNGGTTPDTAASTSAPWTPNEKNARFVRIGSPQNPPDAVVDEFAIWNRILSTQEIAALYAAQQPIGAVCKL
jgi:hypothetical protein